MMRSENRSFSADQFRGRLRFVLIALVLIAVALLVRAVDLQFFDQAFLEKQGDARYTRVAKISAVRGGIYDRNGEALAASTPVDTVWACPPELIRASDQFQRLAEALNRGSRRPPNRLNSGCASCVRPNFWSRQRRVTMRKRRNWSRRESS